MVMKIKSGRFLKRSQRVPSTTPRTRRRRLTRLGLLLGLVLLVGWGVHHWRSVPEPPEPEPVPEAKVEPAVVESPTVVLLLPLSGRFEDDGKMMKMGAELAWHEIDPSESRFHLKTMDAVGDAAMAEGSATLLADDPQVVAVIAHLPERILTKIIPIFEENHLPLLIPAGSHQNLFYHTWVFPLLSSDRTEGAFTARAIHEMLPDGKIAVLAYPDPYGEVLTTGFEHEAVNQQFEYVEIKSGREQDAIARNVEDIIGGGFSAVWLAGPPVWGARVIERLHERSFAGKLLVPRSHALLHPDDLFGDELKKLYFVRSVRDGGDKEGPAAGFESRFQECYWRHPDRLAALAYDAVTWVGGILEQGPAARAAVRQGLLVYDSEAKAFQGVTGRFFFGRDGQIEHSFQIAVYKKGRFVAMEGS